MPPAAPAEGLGFLGSFLQHNVVYRPLRRINIYMLYLCDDMPAYSFSNLLRPNRCRKIFVLRI